MAQSLAEKAVAALDEQDFAELIKLLHEIGELDQESLNLPEGKLLLSPKGKQALKAFVICWRDRGALIARDGEPVLMREKNSAAGTSTQTHIKKTKLHKTARKSFKRKARIAKAARENIAEGLHVLMLALQGKQLIEDYEFKKAESKDRKNKRILDPADKWMDKIDRVDNKEEAKKMLQGAADAIDSYMPFRQKVITRIGRFFAIIFGFACGLTSAKFAILFMGGLIAATTAAAALPVFGIIVGVIATLLLSAMIYKLGRLKSVNMGVLPAIFVAVGALTVVILGLTLFTGVLPMALVLGAGLSALIATTAYNIRLLYRGLPNVLMQIFGGDKFMGFFSYVDADGNKAVLDGKHKAGLSVLSIIFVVSMSLAMTALTLLAVNTIPAALATVFPAILGAQLIFTGLAVVAAGVTFFALIALYGQALSGLYKTILENYKNADNSLIKGLGKMIYNHFKKLFRYWETQEESVGGNPMRAQVKKWMTLIGMPLIISLALGGLVFLCFATVGPLAGLPMVTQSLAWVLGMGVSFVGMLPFVLQTCATMFEKIIDMTVDNPWTTLFAFSAVAALAGGVIFALVNPLIALGVGIAAAVGFTALIVKKVKDKAGAKSPESPSEAENPPAPDEIESKEAVSLGQRILNAIDTVLQWVAEKLVLLVNAFFNGVMAKPTGMAIPFQVGAVSAATYISGSSSGADVQGKLAKEIDAESRTAYGVARFGGFVDHKSLSEAVEKTKGKREQYEKILRSTDNSSESDDNQPSDERETPHH